MRIKCFKIVTIFILFLIIQGKGFAQKEINGRLVDEKTGSGVSYASIRAIEFKNLGAISDEDGYFKILIENELDSLNFNVSASSYAIKNIFLVTSNTLQIITLEEKILDLDEVVVRPLKEGEINWIENSDNLRLYGSINEDGNYVPMMMGLESSGEFHGNAFKLKNTIKVNEIGFHFYMEEGYPDKLYLRIFNTDIKPRLSMNEPLENLEELTKKTILVDNLKDGFNIVDVSEENIIAKPGQLIIAITADINDVSNHKLTIYQQKSSGKDVLRFALNPNHYNIFPPFLPKYVLGIRYVELEENKGVFGWFKKIFK